MVFENVNPRERAVTAARNRATDARHEVGELAVDAAREYFPEEYAEQRREDALKSTLVGGVGGFILGLAFGRLLRR